MTSAAPAPHRTHEVRNQPPPLTGLNVFTEDAVLCEALEREGAEGFREELTALGQLAGSEQAIEWGFRANSIPPRLRTHDRYGHRIDEVEFHPAWHRLMEVAVSRGLHASPWREPSPGAHAARAAGFYTWSQVEAGHGCPISMTYAVIVDAVMDELEQARGGDARLDRALDRLRPQLHGDESEARRVAERLALAIQGSLLVRFSPSAVADAFCASRLGGDGGHELGTLPSGLDLRAIVERHRPQPG